MGTKLSGMCSVFGTKSYSGLAELASRKRSTIRFLRAIMPIDSPIVRRQAHLRICSGCKV